MMTREYPYHKGSWQYVITEVKKSLGINCLTSLQASAIMKMYLSRVSVEEMIDKLKLEDVEWTLKSRK